MWKDLLQQIQQGNIKALARAISFVENEESGYIEFCNRHITLQLQMLLALQVLPVQARAVWLIR